MTWLPTTPWDSPLAAAARRSSGSTQCGHLRRSQTWQDTDAAGIREGGSGSGADRTIEDAFELDLDADRVAHPNAVALQAREPNIEGQGGIDMAELVRWGLRMNPDRVIVGEARGAEVIPLLNAMSQGNDGSLATVHASSSRQAFTRLATYAVQAPERLTFEASAMLIGGAVDFVVHLDWSTTGRRVVSSLREVIGSDGRDVVSNEVYEPGPERRAVPAVPIRSTTLDRLVAAGLSRRVLAEQGW